MQNSTVMLAPDQYRDEPWPVTIQPYPYTAEDAEVRAQTLAEWHPTCIYFLVSEV